MKLTNASAIFSTNDTVSHHPQIRLLDDLPDTYRPRNRESVVRCSNSESTHDSRVNNIIPRSRAMIPQYDNAKKCDFVKLIRGGNFARNPIRSPRRIRPLHRRG